MTCLREMASFFGLRLTTSTLRSHGPRRWALKSSCPGTETRPMALEARIIGRYGFVISMVTKWCSRVQTARRMVIGSLEDGVAGWTQRTTVQRPLRLDFLPRLAVDDRAPSRV